MSKKWLVLMMVMVMATTLLTGCLSSDKKPEAKPDPAKAAATGKKVIRISIGLNEVHPEFLGLKKFKEEIDKKLPGKYDIQLYANAQLGDDVKTTEAARMGNLEMTGPSSSPLTGIVKELGVFDLPFLFPNTKVAYEVMDGPAGQKLLDLMEAKGLKGLAYWENGFRHLTNSAKEVKMPEDVKGLKIRVMQNPIHLATWKALGANPTPMPFSELFTAMQQKTMDGQENPLLIIKTSKFYEVQKYLALTGHFYSPAVLMVSDKMFKGLTADQQKALMDAAKEARDFERNFIIESEKKLVDELKAAKMEVTTPDKALFQKATESVYKKFEADIGKDLIDQVRGTK